MSASRPVSVMRKAYRKPDGSLTDLPSAGTKPVEFSEYSGHFLGFGVEHVEYESGPGQYTIALIEKPDGRIAKVAPERVRFDDTAGGAV